jgi:transposase
MYDSRMMNRTFKTGVDREQGSLLPPRVEDYVSADNPVRAIEAYVDGLNLAKLGFRHARRGVKVGQPPYNPADLLKLYLYGYLNQVRSSRRLEREAQRNLELIWLLGGLKPGYRTIAKFRAENWAALKAANRTFILLAREAGLLSGALVAIDGAFFHGDARKGSITTRKRLTEQLAKLDEDIEAYGIALASNDAEEDRPSGGGDGGGDGEDIGQKMAALMAKRTKAQEEIDRLDESGETQLSRTDPDARLLTKSGQAVAGYNVQVAVDEKHKLIVASEVVNDGNDTGQLYPMAKVAQEALGAETLQVVADTGYYNGNTLKACEDDKIVAYVPQVQRSSRLKKQGRFSHEDFSYDAEADVYRCPAGAALTPSKTLKHNGDRMERRYTSRQAVCGACALRERCVTAKTPVRTVRRWEHEDVLDRHRARMNDAGDDMMRRRASLAEHPFGTLKCRAGYRHFLVRGFNKVRGEWSLMALCYNLTRVLNILGIEGFKAKLALWAVLLHAIGAARGTRAVLSSLWTKNSPNVRAMPLCLSPAA